MYYPLGPFKKCWPLVTGCREGDGGPANVLDGCGTETLDRWLLVYTKHQGLIRRIQVERHDVCRFLGKLRVSAQTLTAAALQVNAVPSQHAPHLVGRHISQGLGHQTPVPGSVFLRRCSVQLG